MVEITEDLNVKIIEPTIVLTEEQKGEILGLFKQRCEQLNIKQNTKTFFKEQAAFISGLSCALYVLAVKVPPYWTIATMSDRSIIEKL